MARSFLTALNLNKNELQNAAVQNLASAPSSPVKGQLYYNSTGGDDTLYWWNGSTWVAAKSSSSISPATTVTTQAVGDAAVVGTSTTYAREDHKHGREAFGVITAEGTFGSASTNGIAATVARSDHAHGNPVHNAAAHSAIPLSALAAATAAISMGGFQINNLGTPGTGTDATTKTYVDNLVLTNINYATWKNAVRCATTANIALTGSIVIDGVTPTADVDHVLVKNQTTPSQNGIYYANSGAWYRTEEAATGQQLVSASTFVKEGTVNADTAWICTNDSIVLGTTGLTFAQFAGPPVAAVSFNSQRITNLATPSAGTDATTKTYVDNLVNGLSWKSSVQAATTANITLSGSQVIDGISVPVTGSNGRVLVKNQTTPSQNGIYVASAGAWVRATDFDVEQEIPGAAVYVTSGTTQGDTSWAVTSPDSEFGFTLGTSGIQFGQVSGPGAITGGAGLTQTGNTLNVGAGTGITVAADSVALDTTYTDTRYGMWTTDATGIQYANAITVGGVRVPIPGGSSIGRLSALPGVPNWLGTFINAQYSASGWLLDDTSRYGMFFKLDVRNTTDNFAVYRIPPGAGAHTDETPIVTFDNSTGLGRLVGDPTVPLGIATKQYVDTATAVFTSSVKGEVPASGGGTTNFMRADGTWTAPAGGGVSTVGGTSTDNALVRYDSTAGTSIQNSGAILDDSNNLTGIVDFTNTGDLLGTNFNRLNRADLPTGYIAQTLQRTAAASSIAAVQTGNLRMYQIWLVKGMVVNSFTMFASTGVTGLTNSWASLFDSSLVMLAISADQTPGAWTVGTSRTFAVANVASGAASSFTITATGLHYVGIMVAGTTMPFMLGVTTSAAAGIYNLTPRLSIQGASGLTTPLAFPFTATLGAAVAVMPWIGIQ